MNHGGPVVHDEAHLAQQVEEVVLGLQDARLEGRVPGHRPAEQVPSRLGMLGVDADLEPARALLPRPGHVAVGHRGQGHGTVVELLGDRVADAPGQLPRMVPGLPRPEARGERLHPRQSLGDGHDLHQPLTPATSANQSATWVGSKSRAAP